MLAAGAGLAPVARAELGCEQLYGVAATTIQMRDRGASLPQLLADADRLRDTPGLSREDVADIETVIGLAYLRTRSPHEILEACRASARR